jgi:hypothetical protein
MADYEAARQAELDSVLAALAAERAAGEAVAQQRTATRSVARRRGGHEAHTAHVHVHGCVRVVCARVCVPTHAHQPLTCLRRALMH